jgi:hypothetical protein
MTTTPDASRLDADHVLAAIEAATTAATEDGPPVHPAAHREAVSMLYLRALGLGVALIGAELAEIRGELHDLTKATYSAGGV